MKENIFILWNMSDDMYGEFEIYGIFKTREEAQKCFKWCKKNGFYAEDVLERHSMDNFIGEHCIGNTLLTQYSVIVCNRCKHTYKNCDCKEEMKCVN